MTQLRVLRTAAEQLTHVFYVDGQPTDATGDVTVTVTRAADGVEVATGTAAHPDTGTYTYTFPASADLDVQVVAWTGTVGSAPVTAFDYVEVVGGFYFPISDMWAPPWNLPATKYPAAMLAERRIDTEDECERICRRSFVPRFDFEQLVGDGTPRLGVARRELRTLRAVTVNGTAWSTDEVAAVKVHAHGVLLRPGGAVWPAEADIVVEYEHGLNYPPAGIPNAAKRRLRSLLSQPSTGTPERAQSWTTNEGGTYRIVLPDENSTGIPDVDAVYHALRRRPRAVTA